MSLYDIFLAAMGLLIISLVLLYACQHPEGRP